MISERRPKLAHRLHPLVEFGELRAQEVAHAPALRRAFAADDEQPLDLFEREAQALRLLDEADPLDGYRGKQAEATSRAGRARQQPSALVVADGVD